MPSTREQEFAAARSCDHRPSSPEFPDPLSRQVYCVLGIPIDAVDMPFIVRAIEASVEQGTPYLISTPNLNFLVNSRSNAAFRESLQSSDLCPADGMPIIWIARLLGLPIRQRFAGSDIFDALKVRSAGKRPLTVFLFGGAEGVAAAASDALNKEACALACVGHLNPGFGDVDALSDPGVIGAINASNADFLLVALGAANGQAWLVRNHDRLRIPVRSHLGATINFQAARLKRAPSALRRLGLEWLWRIKEEPYLWRRYWNDGLVLSRLLMTRVLPLVIDSRLSKGRVAASILIIDAIEDDETIVLRLRGPATAHHVDGAIAKFRSVLSAEPPVVMLDFSETMHVDARFLGLLMILRRQLRRRGAALRFRGLSHAMRRRFRLHEADFLLSEGSAG